MAIDTPVAAAVPPVDAVLGVVEATGVVGDEPNALLAAAHTGPP